MIKFSVKYWFLIGLALAMVVGYLFARSLQPISSLTWLQTTIVMSVMFLMALPLPLSMITETIRRPWASLLASTVSFVLLPVVAWGMSGLVGFAFYAGFLVVAATPCTLASAAVWTRRAGGNDVTALMTTVITNSISFLVTPLIVLLLLNKTAEIEFGDMVLKLGLLVLLPMIVAQLLAARKTIGRWARNHKQQLGIAAQVGILLIVLLGTARSTLKLPEDRDPNLWQIVGLVLACAALHSVVLIAGIWLARALKFSRADQIAVAFSGSQKTLMIGLLVCLQLNVSLVPMVVYHAVQLVIDTFVADWFVRHSSGADA